ncbi:LysR substrate-binding domain-containing protein [Seohaeicola zhoushanensis]
MRETLTEQLIEALQAGELDAAVLALPTGAAGLIEVPLFRDNFLLAGSEARLARLGDKAATLSPADLEPSQLLLLEDGHCLTDQALAACGKERGAPGINMGASSLATLSRLVAAGFGFTLMPELAAEAERTAAPGLELHRFPLPEPSRTIGLVRRATMPGEGWFDELAAMIRRVGEGIVGATRAA